MAKIFKHEFAGAFGVWLMATLPDAAVRTEDDYEECDQAFEKMLGLSFAQIMGTAIGSQRTATVAVTEDQARVIRSICGPHGYAYCKALMANLPQK